MPCAGDFEYHRGLVMSLWGSATPNGSNAAMAPKAVGASCRKRHYLRAEGDLHGSCE
jgi:hypothetical protein